MFPSSLSSVEDFWSKIDFNEKLYADLHSARNIVKAIQRSVIILKILFVFIIAFPNILLLIFLFLIGQFNYLNTFVFCSFAYFKCSALKSVISNDEIGIFYNPVVPMDNAPTLVSYCCLVWIYRSPSLTSFILDATKIIRIFGLSCFICKTAL